MWDCNAFTAELRKVGLKAYHDQHPFHVLMNTGRLTASQLRGWIANRFHYQRHIPIKDAAILSNCPLPEVRRIWIHRIYDHDGKTAGEGGIEAWLRLAEAAGLSRSEVLDEGHVVPGVRFAVDAYVQLARIIPWQVAVASSLTEMFAPDLMSRRLCAFEQHYKWISASGLDYFRSRVTQAGIDSNEGLRLTLDYCSTAELQQQAVGALKLKCEILWAILDSIQAAYPGHIDSNGAAAGIHSALRQEQAE
jgi:pyrroloquinoline-quinone synthase